MPRSPARVQKRKGASKKFETPPCVNVVARRSERISTLSKSSGLPFHASTAGGDEEDPDLSQNLLEETQGTNKGRNTVTQEINFDAVDDDEISSVAVNKKSRRLSTVNETGSSASSIVVAAASVESVVTGNSVQSVAATVQSNITPGGHGFPKAGGDSSNELRCAALEFCVMPKGDLQSIVSTCVCINCNFTTHIECADHLFVQKPRKDGPIDYRGNLSIDGKARLVNWRGDRDDIMICLSCISNIKTRLQGKAGGAPLKRPKKQTYEKFVKNIVSELRGLAIVHAMSYVFGGEAKTNLVKQQELRDLFYGTDKIKSMAEQLIDGDGPFHHLYEMIDGPNGAERTLKHEFYRSMGTMSLVVGRDIKLSEIVAMSNGAKPRASSTLWTCGMNILKSVKKAMSLVPRLSPKMIQVDGTKYIVGYSSGNNFKSFLEAINTGMYVLKDDEEFVRASNKKNGVDDDEDSCEVMIKSGRCSDWDPFGDDEAPAEFMFLGFIAFACIGPGCNDPTHFSPLLRANVRQNLTKEQRKEMSRNTLRINTAKTAKIERQDRKANAVNMQTNCDIATIALAKAEAMDRADDRKLLALTSQLDAKRLEVDVVSKLLVGCDDDDEVTELRESLKTLRTEIRQLTSEIATWSNRAVVNNNIVDSLLANAESMMGIKGNNNDAAKGNNDDAAKGNNDDAVTSTDGNEGAAATSA